MFYIDSVKKVIIMSFSFHAEVSQTYYMFLLFNIKFYIHGKYYIFFFIVHMPQTYFWELLTLFVI